MSTLTLRRVFGTTFATLALLTAACGSDGGDSTGPSNDNDGPTGGGSEVTRLTVTNSSSRSAWYIYARQCGVVEWGEDELGSSNILSPNETVSWRVSEPGCYDIRALNDPTSDEGEYEALWMSFDVPAGRTTTLSIGNDDWHAVPAVMATARVRKTDAR